jgi:hypothetical protein
VNLPVRRAMSERDARQLIQKLNEALYVIRRNDGSLSGREVRLKTMLGLMRAEVVEALAEAYDSSRDPDAFVKPEPRVLPGS